MAHEYHYDKEVKLIQIRWLGTIDFTDIYHALLTFDFPRPESGHRIILDFSRVKESRLMSDDLMHLAKLVKQHLGEKIRGAKIAILTVSPEWRQRARFYIMCRKLLCTRAPEYEVFSDIDNAISWTQA